jgi:hypothetical protein
MNTFIDVFHYFFLNLNKIISYLTYKYLLSFPKNWCIQFCTLFMRAKIEASSVRRMERSLMQLENLIDHFKQPNDKPDFKFRLQFFYQTGYPSFWILQVYN